MLPALLTEWPGSFTCHCGNTGLERTPNKIQHTKLTLEKKILPPLLPDFELATFRSRGRRSYQHAIPTPLYKTHLDLKLDKYTKLFYVLCHENAPDSVSSAHRTRNTSIVVHALVLKRHGAARQLTMIGIGTVTSLRQAFRVPCPVDTKCIISFTSIRQSHKKKIQRHCHDNKNTKAYQ